MILYDPALNMNFRDYGIMLPIAPDRGRQILEFTGKNYYPGARGDTMPYPGPVMDIADAFKFLGIAGNSKTETSLIAREDLERVHSKDFIASLYDKQKNGLETALLTTYELIDAQGRPNRYEPEKAKKPLNDLFGIILAQVSGTYLACRLALAYGPGFCYFLGGGMHHARYNSGSGFCLLNDVTIAAIKILRESPAKLIWIIDLDAHKGDGTAELIHFARRRGELQAPLDSVIKEKPCVLTLSVHMAKGWPLDKESLAVANEGRAPLQPSDIDIGINEGEEGEYVSRLAEGIQELERITATLNFNAGQDQAASSMHSSLPDLVLVVDGADPYEHDELPSTSLLKLSLEQCLLRDNYVYRYVMDRCIPSAWIQSGGYGSRAWEPPAYFLQDIR